MRRGTASRNTWCDGCRPILRDLHDSNSAARLLIRYGRDTAATAVLAAVENIRTQLHTHVGPAWLEREKRRAFQESIDEIVHGNVPQLHDDEDEEPSRYVVMESEDLADQPLKTMPTWRGAHWGRRAAGVGRRAASWLRACLERARTIEA